VFTVADDAARARVAALQPAADAALPAQILYATSLEADGYLSDARAAWKALGRQYPDVAEIKQRVN